MRQKILTKIAHWAVRRTWWVLGIVLIVTIIFGVMASRLKMTMRWSDLMPEHDERTIEFNNVIEEFSSASTIVVVIQGVEEQTKAFAEAVVPKIEAEKEFVRRVDYKREVDFLKVYGLLLMKTSDLENTKEIFTDANLIPLLANINNTFEKEYKTEESLSTRAKEDGAVMFLDGIESWIEAAYACALNESVPPGMPKKAVDSLLVGEPYILSYDKRVLLVIVYPTFSITNINKAVDSTNRIQEIVDEALPQFPGIKAGLSGTIPLARDEVVTSQKSLGYTSLIALFAIIALFIISFRMWVAPILAGINLLIGVIWAMGLSWMLVGTLNIMTSMFAVVLLGLGVDFSIHLISGFTERRSMGMSTADAMRGALAKTGPGIMTGGLTTACAFFTLMIGASRGMDEMGLVTGAGLIAIMLATLTTLPALLALREKRIERKRQAAEMAESPLDNSNGDRIHCGNSPTSQETRSSRINAEGAVAKDITFKFLGDIVSVLAKRYPLTIATSVMLTAFLLVATLIWPRIKFDHNYMNMEAKGLESVELQDTILEKFDLGMDFALIVAKGIDESRSLSKRAKELSTVAIVEDISAYLPSEEEQAERMSILKEIAEQVQAHAPVKPIHPGNFEELIAELERLQDNIVELQDMAFIGGQDKVDRKCISLVGDPEKADSSNIISAFIGELRTKQKIAIAGLNRFQSEYAPLFRDNAIKMTSAEPIDINSLPQSIIERFASKSKDKFLVTIYPSGNIWQDLKFSHRFTDDLETVDKRATGTPLVFRALIDIIGRDGKRAAILTLVVIFFLLWLDYRSIKHSLLAMVPLVSGVIWMVGCMSLIGMQLTLVNVMGIPMILGIGIDDGVHILHRYRAESKGRNRNAEGAQQSAKRTVATVFASTGKAILLTTLTTMIAFGSLMFSIYRGFASLGGAMFIGVGMCFLTTIIILPGLIGWVEN